jgi:hypothetical protein
MGRALKLAWLATAALVLLPVLPVHSESPVAITPPNVYSYESENFLVTVNDTRPLPISSVSVTTPLDLQIVGTDQNPNWSHLLTRNQSSYTAAWYGLSKIQGGRLIQPGNSSTLGFSANVPGPGTYHLAVTALYFDGSSESWQTVIVVSNPSLLGLDIRTLVYILGAIVILLPVSQSIVLALRRRGGAR